MSRDEFLIQLRKVIERADRMIICGHVRPDGDAIGVSVALAHIMAGMGKHPMIYCEGDLSHYPWILEDPNMMKGIDLLCSFDELSAALRGRFAFFMLDVAEPERAGEAKICMKQCEVSVCMDHHVNHGEYADLNLIVPEATSASEVLYTVARELNWPLDEVSAAALFTGLAFDTGGFRHSSVTPFTFEMAADLTKYQVPVTRIMNSLFHTRSFSEQRMMGAILSKAKLYEKERVILSGMDKADFLKMGGSANDCEGAVAMLAETSGCEVAIFLRELDAKAGQAGQKNQIRVNLRSKEYVDVSEVAAHFGGGGHRRASGCTICEPMLLVKQMLLEEIRKQLDQHEAEES